MALLCISGVYAYGDLTASEGKPSLKERAEMYGKVNENVFTPHKSKSDADPEIMAILNESTNSGAGLSRKYWGERGGAILGLGLKATEYQSNNLHTSNPLEILTPDFHKICPGLLDLLAKIACEDDMRTPRAWGMVVKTIEAFKDRPDLLNVLAAILNVLDPDDTLGDVKKKIDEIIDKYSQKTAVKSVLLMKFLPFIKYFASDRNKRQLLAFRNILASKGQSFEVWYREQFGTESPRSIWGDHEAIRQKEAELMEKSKQIKQRRSL